MKVACVLRFSDEYDEKYVEHLRDGVEKYLLGAEFICLSDVPVPCERIPLRHPEWPGWWSKMELLSPWIEGDLLYFDLDTIITGDLSEIASVGKLTLLSDFYEPGRLASGMMFLPERDRIGAWSVWMEDPVAHMNLARSRGDGGFLDRLWSSRAARWQNTLPSQVVSYKAHVREKTHVSEIGNGEVPENARAVCFHGRPRPRDIKWSLAREPANFSV